MADILVVGSLNVDLVAFGAALPEPGQTLIGSRFLTAFGGKGANQAFAAAGLGGSVAMIGNVGDDHHGKSMIANLEDRGCSIDSLRSVDGPSGVALILVGDHGRNMIVVVPGANAKLSPADVELADFSDARFLLLQLESPMATVISAARKAKQAGITVILDPAPAVDNPPEELLTMVDILTPNETEAAQLAGIPARNLDDEQAVAVARQLQQRTRGVVILKMGARGCFVRDRSREFWQAAPAVAAVDSTAAGDVFNGALAVALSEGAALDQACRFACGAAAQSVTAAGAQPSMPSREEIDRLLQLPARFGDEETGL